MANHIEITRREWAYFGLRWVLPITVFLSLLTTNGSGQQNMNLILAVGVVGAVMNLVLLLLFFGELWSPITVWLTIGLDMLLTWAAVAVVGSSIVWVGLLPIVAGALYFQFIEATAISVLTAGGCLIVMLLQPVLVEELDLPTLILTLTALPAAGPAISFISKEDPETIRLRNKASTGIRTAERMRGIAAAYVNIAYDMTDVLSTSQLDPRRVLRAVTSFSLEGLERVGITPPLYGAVLLFAESEEGIQTNLRIVQASMSVPGSDKELIVEGNSGILQRSLQRHEPGITSNPAADPELGRFQSFGSFCKTVASLPLRSGNEVYGVLLIGSEEKDAFDDMHIAIMRAIANQAAASLNNARLYGNLIEQRDRLVEVEKSARAQLASELHDGPTQGVAAITMRLNFIRKLLDRKPEKAAEELYQIEDVARRTTKEIRHMLFELRPKALEQGLSSGLEQLAVKTKDTFDQAMEVQVAEGIDAALDEQTTQTLFSITMETVNNARKHANAELIRVRVGQMDDDLIMEIRDNGTGFDVERKLEEAKHREGHLGLLNLFERAHLIEGTMSIQSSPEDGTRTTVRVPMEIIRHRKQQDMEREAERAANRAAAGQVADNSYNFE